MAIEVQPETQACQAGTGCQGGTGWTVCPDREERLATASRDPKVMKLLPTSFPALAYSAARFLERFWREQKCQEVEVEPVSRWSAIRAIIYVH